MKIARRLEHCLRPLGFRVRVVHLDSSGKNDLRKKIRNIAKGIIQRVVGPISVALLLLGPFKVLNRKWMQRHNLSIRNYVLRESKPRISVWSETESHFFACKGSQHGIHKLQTCNFRLIQTHVHTLQNRTELPTHSSQTDLVTCKLINYNRSPAGSSGTTQHMPHA